MSDHDDPGLPAPETPNAAPAAQGQPAEHEPRPNKPGKTVCISKCKLEAIPFNTANGGVNSNLEDTEETNQKTASDDAETLDMVKDCKPVVRGKQMRKATLKQRKFAAEYTNPYGAKGNGTLAARLAGYKGDSNQLGVQASVNLRNPKIKQLISGMLDSMTERALQRLGEALDATSSRAFLDKEGNVVYTEPVPDHRTRLHALGFLFDLRGKCGVADAPDGGEVVHADGAVVDGEQIVDSDRALFEQAAAIEDELAELDSLNDGGDHEHDE
jgi:phage terminase small subunit